MVDYVGIIAIFYWKENKQMVNIKIILELWRFMKYIYILLNAINKSILIALVFSTSWTASDVTALFPCILDFISEV